ncbi:hypothetical protein AA0X95_17725 [Bacillus sp. 1P10SD]|uniref:hypothetical protein n=1 Tax=Bacillus sp. 1P10SD TaxID=3132265 RepID=UPI0039A5E19A
MLHIGNLRKIIIIDFVIFNGNIAVATTDRTYLVKDEGGNKSIVWEKDVGGNNLNFDELSIYIANNNVIHSLNGQTGELKWSYTIPAATVIQGTISVLITIAMLMEANKLPTSEIWVGQRLIIQK